MDKNGSSDTPPLILPAVRGEGGYPSSHLTEDSNPTNGVVSKVENEVLALKEVCYDVVNVAPRKKICEKRVKTKLRLLHEVNFDAKRGTCNAIIGRSGSGKTTMLDILAGRKDITSGNVCCPKHVGYVLQSSLLIDSLTVKETIEFALVLKHPELSSKQDRDRKVRESIERLNLVEKANILIGGGSHGGKILSGGEKRRVYVGRELVVLLDEPDAVLLLDEPTTGLDAASSRRLVEQLSSLAHNIGCTVVMSVHNPRYSTFSLFHSVTIVDQGYIMYRGCPKGLNSYLLDLGFICLEQENIADFVIDVLDERRLLFSDVEGGGNSSEGKKIETLDVNSIGFLGVHEGTVAHAMHTKYCSELVVLEELQPFKNPEESSDDPKRSSYSLSPYKKTIIRAGVLCSRYWRMLLRKPTSFRLTILTRAVMSIIMGLIYSKQKHDVQGLQNISGLFFFMGINHIFSVASETVNSLIEEHSVLREEAGNNYYGPGTFLVCKLIMQVIPLQLVPSFLYSIVVYWTVDLRAGAHHFLFFVFAVFILNFLGYSFINGISIILHSKNLPSALIATPLYMSIMIIFAGIFVRLSQVHYFLRWLQYLSVFYLGYGAMIANEVDGAPPYTCAPVLQCDTIPGRTFIVSNLGYNLLGSKWYYIAIMIAYSVVMNILFYFGLVRDLRTDKAKQLGQGI